MASREAVGGWIIAAALGLGAGGCSGPLTSPLDGGRAWRELRSQHYTLSTNASTDEGSELLQLLEDGHFALQRAAFPSATPLGGNTRVVFIDGLDGLDELGHVRAAGVGTRPSLQFDDDLFVLSDPDSRFDLEFLRHELTHRFVNFYYPNAPLWLNEGLAEYYSTLEVAGSEVSIGGYLGDYSFASHWGWANHRVVIATSDVPGVAALRAMSAEAFYAREKTVRGDHARLAHYAGAWALIHTLVNVQGPQGLKRYLYDLGSGTMSEAEAWRRTFGSVEPTLERRFRTFLLSYETTTVRVAIGVPPRVEPTERPLSASEVHTLWALARNRGTAAGRAAIRADLDRAIAADPNEPEPYLRRALLSADEGKLAAAEADHRKAVALGRSESRYTLGLALFALSQAEKVETRQLDTWAGTIGKTARSAAELDFLAQWALARGRRKAAASYARRAILSDYDCFNCFATLARCSAAGREWADAVKAMQIAINLMPHSWQAPDYVELLTSYERELATSSAEPAPDSD